MSTVSPYLGGIPTTIGDLANRVVKKLENRTSLIGDAYEWVRDSLIEVTTNTDLRDDFDELEIWGSPFTLNSSDTEYDFSNLMPAYTDPLTDAPGVTYNMATLDVLLWSDPPLNNNRIQLVQSHYQRTDRGVATTKGQPAEWYRFGNMIGFNPSPDKAYQVQARILRMHPISDPAVELTEILVGPEWYEVIVFGALERGYIDLQEFDKANSIHVLLHGDPKYPAKVGMLHGAKKRRKREAHRQSGCLQPVLRGYNWGRY